MLDDLKKYLNIKTPKEETVSLEDNSQLESISLQLQEALTKLSHNETTIAELTSKLAQTQELVAEAEAARSALVQEAADAKLKQRKESLENVVGTVRADALLSKLEVLDDESFASVVESLNANFEKESEGELFNELGIAAEAVVSEPKPAHFSNYIKK